MTNSHPGGSRAAYKHLSAGRHPSVAAQMAHFAYGHLPPALQAVSAPFGLLAVQLLDMLPDSPELAAGLRKLIEAKDCAVRAHVDATLDDATVPNTPESGLRA